MIATLDAGKVFGRYQSRIKGMAVKFARKYGEEIEELISEASVLLVKAIQSYDEDKGALQQRIKAVVWNGWLDYHKHKVRKLKGYKCCGEPHEDDTVAKPNMWEQLSEEANEVIRLCLNPPTDVEVTAQLIHSKMRPVSIRLAVKEYLTEEGWDTQKIEQVFAEVREVLAG